MPPKKTHPSAGAATMPPLRRYPAFPKAEFYLGLALFAALGLCFRFTDIDLVVARLAYAASDPHWAGQSTAPWSWLYHYGEAPAAAAGLAGLLAFLASFK